MGSEFEAQLFEEITPSIRAFFEQKKVNGDLFTEDDDLSLVDIWSRYFERDAPSIVKHEELRDQVQDWEGWDKQQISSVSEMEEIITKKSPASHIITLSLVNSWSEIEVNASLFQSIMTQCGIFAKFLEFVLSFGKRDGEIEVGPPPVRLRTYQLPANRSDFLLQAPGPLARTTKIFELAYGLRFVELNGRSDDFPWSLRQSAVYHQYRLDGTSTWLLIAPSSEATHQLNSYFQRAQIDLRDLDPLEFHALLIDWSLANWRAYMIWLSERADSQTNTYLLAAFPVNPLIQIGLDEQKNVKQLEDHVLDLLVSIDSTIDNINYLLARQDEIPHTRPELGLDPPLRRLATLSLTEKHREALLLRKRAESLYRKVERITQLISSLLDLKNGHALRDLAEQSREENTGMRILTEKGTRDAAAVKVLTVITLIYLPSSAVANVFSTQFVQNVQTSSSTASDSTSNSYKMVYADNTWLYWAIAAPLTVFTLIVWVFWVNHKSIYAAMGRQRPNDDQSSTTKRKDTWDNASFDEGIIWEIAAREDPV